MYVSVRSEPQLWTVGYYSPDGKWQPESDHGTPLEAGERVRYLNGGNGPATISGAECPVFDDDIGRAMLHDLDLPHAPDPLQRWVDAYGATIQMTAAAFELSECVDEEDADDLLGTYTALKAAADAIDRRMKEVKRAVEGLLSATGKDRLVGAHATASWTAGYERTSFDAKALTTLCHDDPALDARLMPYRKVTSVERSVRIESVRVTRGPGSLVPLPDSVIEGGAA